MNSMRNVGYVVYFMIYICGLKEYSINILQCPVKFHFGWLRSSLTAYERVSCVISCSDISLMSESEEE